MNKQDKDEFNVSEYKRKIHKRHKLVTVGLIVVALVTLAGMIAFWH